MNRQPLVSVIMPVYNCKRYLRDAIESILHQTYNNIELIIVDDHSTDGTTKIIKEYTKRFSPFVKAVFLRKHSGDNTAANKAFVHAKGVFIARMDGDDIAHPLRIAKQVTFLLQEENVLVLGTQGYIINKENTLLGEKKFPRTHQDIYNKFGVYNPMLHPSCIFRRSLLPYKTKLYKATHTIHDDYYTFFSYLGYGKFANLPEKLLYYRIHGRNASLNRPKKRFWAIQNIRQDAVTRLSYKMTLFARIINVLQTVIITVLPESSIVPLYMLLQGMYSPLQLLKKRIGLLSPVSDTVVSQEV